MHDALFRTNSAVILPEGEDPNSKQGGGRALTAVGLFATLLRYNEEHPSSVGADGKESRKKLLIAGHTDTAGKDADNQKLSEERAEVTLALLSGDRDKFAKLCQKRHDGVDLTQIFHWVSDSPDFEFDCKPTLYDQPPSSTSVTRFKTAYNAAFDAKFATINGAKKFTSVNGTQDEALWGAVFDCYEYNLRCELDDMEETAEGTQELTRLRSELTWVDDSRKTMGFGEKFPVDNATKNSFRSQSNRRVEIMMFDEGEEPDLAAAIANPDVMETYLPAAYGKKPVEPMVSARRAASVILNATEPAPWSTDARMRLIAEDMSIVSEQAIADGEPYGTKRIFRFRGSGTGTVCRIAVTQDDVTYYLSDWLVIRDAAFIPASFDPNGTLIAGLDDATPSTAAT